MKTLPSEMLLFESLNKRLVVTTHRVRYERQGGGAGIIKSIMLEEVASCAMTRDAHPSLLALAALCFLAGLIGCILIGIGAFFLGVVSAGPLVLAYFLSRAQVIVIASAGTTVIVNVHYWNIEDIRELLHQIEAAKNARYLLLRPPPVPKLKP